MGKFSTLSFNASAYSSSALSYCTNIMFLDIIHRPISISKHNVSETGLPLRFQVKPIQFGSIDRASPYLQTLVLAPR
jgi:hypothetical protein